MDIQHFFDISKWTFLAGTMFLFVAVGFFLQGCDQMKATEERDITVTIKTGQIPNEVVPPLDASAPFQTETATFALG